MERDEYTDRYVNPYTDFGFKKLFGTEMNKELLISFINSLLSDKEQIRDLTYLNTENLGISEADRKAVFDVYCETDSGEKILVEMQLGQQLFFKERSLYYASFPIQQQGKHGDWNYQLKAVYVIAILNFVFDHIHDGYFHHEVQLTDSKTREVFYDKLTFIYLEMPKFNKKEEELDSMFDKWLFVLRNLTRLMEKPAAATLSSRREATVSRISFTGCSGTAISSSPISATRRGTRPACFHSRRRKSATLLPTSTSAQWGDTRISPTFSRVRPRPIRLPKKSRWVGWSVS